MKSEKLLLYQTREYSRSQISKVYSLYCVCFSKFYSRKTTKREEKLRKNKEIRRGTFN